MIIKTDCMDDNANSFERNKNRVSKIIIAENN